MDNLNYEIFKLVLTSDPEQVEKAIETTKKVLERLFSSENTTTIIPPFSGTIIPPNEKTWISPTADYSHTLPWLNHSHGEEF
jgi:hypothetical protein